jgi:hypothetical protein
VPGRGAPAAAKSIRAAALQLPVAGGRRSGGAALPRNPPAVDPSLLEQGWPLSPLSPLRGEPRRGEAVAAKALKEELAHARRRSRDGVAPRLSGHACPAWGQLLLSGARSSSPVPGARSSLPALLPPTLPCLLWPRGTAVVPGAPLPPSFPRPCPGGHGGAGVACAGDGQRWRQDGEPLAMERPSSGHGGLNGGGAPQCCFSAS